MMVTTKIIVEGEEKTLQQIQNEFELKLAEIYNGNPFFVEKFYESATLCIDEAGIIRIDLGIINLIPNGNVQIITEKSEE